MKHLLLFIHLVFAVHSFAQQNTYLDSILVNRNNKDQEFFISEYSPLLEKDRKAKNKLKYYIVNPSYIVKAKFKKVRKSKKFKMKTSTDRLPEYKKYGIVHFSLPGSQERFKLSVYQNVELIKKNEHKNSLFLPFTDLTSGEETYGGGRYLDLKKPANGAKELTLDFNQLYNPYCAYNHNYSCPIPPVENFVNHKIEAGEKNYKKDH